MFRRESAPAGLRPMTGSEMEAAAEREKWLERVQKVERAVGWIAVPSALCGAVFGNESVKRVCDFAILVLGVVAFAVRRKASRHP